MKTTQEDKWFINLAGEFAVASELNRRKIHASVTYGAFKKTDVFAVAPSGDKIQRIEVKSTVTKKWPIGQRGAKPDDKVLWVLVHLPLVLAPPRFFVLTAQEIFDAYDGPLKAYYARYRAKHGKEFLETGGVPNVALKEVERHENMWGKITARLREAP